jgi:tRNA-Thr(GGU) m(6)t(6)A37 methyltransferase TsaA
MGIRPVGGRVQATSECGAARANVRAMSEAAKSNETTGDDDHDGLRPGEISAPLPDRFDASLYYIGRIRTPWKTRDECPKNGRESDEVCSIEVDPRWVAGLQGLETVSHVLVLYWMDKARRDLLVQAPRHYTEHRGTFALRSPVRPNPIAAAVTQLKRIEGNKLFVIGLDCLDGTPLLDLKPYFASTDSAPDASVGWHAARKR